MGKSIGEQTKYDKQSDAATKGQRECIRINRKLNPPLTDQRECISKITLERGKALCCKAKQTQNAKRENNSRENATYKTQKCRQEYKCGENNL